MTPGRMNKGKFTHQIREVPIISGYRLRKSVTNLPQIRRKTNNIRQAKVLQAPLSYNPQTLLIMLNEIFF